MSGLFITMEGSDGSGKSTQIELLRQYLSDRGYKVICTREPGGTPIGEKIRKIIIDKNNREMSVMTEVFLYAASRAQHVNEVILPALREGDVVISDRFLDSSVVYQGFARCAGEKLVKKINKTATGDLEPDITFLLRLKPEQGILRKKEQTDLDRLESEKFSFHQRVYEGYAKLAKSHKERIKVIDAEKDIDEIQYEIREKVYEFLEKHSI